MRQTIVQDLLAEAGLRVESEKNWPWLHRPGIGQRMSVDIFVPAFSVAIEYDGKQHRQIAFGCTPEQFSSLQSRDVLKEKLLKEHEIRLIRLSGWPVDIEALIRDIKKTV